LLRIIFSFEKPQNLRESAVQNRKETTTKWSLGSIRAKTNMSEESIGSSFC